MEERRSVRQKKGITHTDTTATIHLKGSEKVKRKKEGKMERETMNEEKQ